MSSSGITIEIKESEIQRINKMLGSLKGNTEDVLYRAINRTITNVKKNMAMAASKEYFVTSTQVKRTINITKATKGKLVAKAISKSPTIPLSKFRVSPNRPVSYNTTVNHKSSSKYKYYNYLKNYGKANPSMYKAGTKRGEQLKAFGNRPKAFIAVMKSGHVGFFVRINDSQKQSQQSYYDNRKGNKKVRNNAIKQLFGPSIAQMVGNEKIVSHVQNEANNMLHKRIDAELNNIMR